MKNKEKEKRKQYWLDNAEKLKKGMRQYYLNNKEKIKKIRKKYYLKNAEMKKKYQKQYWLKNSEKKQKYQKKYRLNNLKRLKKECRQWSLNNREKINYYNRYRRKTDPLFKLVNNLRSRMWAVLKGKSKSKTTIKLLGCSVEECWNYLEKQFKPRMTRKNYGKWHVDHIRPCASFDLSNPKQQAICFHYTNLQPLWSYENESKGAKYEME